jgi:rare lipoprotein A
MVIRRKSPSIGFKTQLGICLLAGASTGVLVAVVVPNSTPPVQADARLSKSVSTWSTAASVATVAAIAPAAAVTSATAVAPVLAPTPVFAVAPPKPVQKSRTDILRGIATWYGSVLNGHRTASGERFDMYAMTACHPTLPFGTMVRVVNLNTKKSVVVRINDRGELSKGRIIDLSYAAAQALEITKAGIAPVALDVLSLGKSHHKE